MSVLDATPILAFDGKTQRRVTRAFDFAITLWTGKTKVMTKFMTAHQAAFLSTFLELGSMKIFGPLVSVEKVAGVCKQVQNVIFRVALAIRTGAPTPMNASLEASLGVRVRRAGAFYRRSGRLTKPCHPVRRRTSRGSRSW